jgi:stage IV sporulation protein FB
MPFMNSRLNAFAWSMGLGRWSGVEVRVSWLQPVVWLWLWFEFGELATATAVFGCLCVSLLLHELGHVVVARKVGASADTILLWPFGGLASVRGLPSPQARVLVAAAGPLVNLVLLVACLPYTLSWAQAGDSTVAAVTSESSPTVSAAPERVTVTAVATAGVESSGRPSPWNPLVFPISRLGKDWLGDLQVMLFSINWMLLLINLIPAAPLDGHEMTRGVLEQTGSHDDLPELLFRISFAAGVVLLVAAMLFLKSPLLVGLASILMIFALMERTAERFGDGYDDSFLGYDFSAGYTSLEKSQPGDAAAANKPAGTMLQRWRERRKADRERKLAEEAARDEADLDQLLAKVHEQGMRALSAAEKRQLERVSVRMRDRRTS